MGSCMSSRSKKGAALLKKQSTAPASKHKSNKMESEAKAQGRGKRGMPYSRGQATSFGFKRPVSSTPIANNNQIASSPEELGDSLDLLVISQSTARCGTPRLARPKKDANGNSNTRTNRFGFRGGTPLSNKVADSQANNDAAHYMYTPDACRVDSSKPTLKFSGNRSSASESGQSHSSGSDNNDSNHQSGITNPQSATPTRFTLHTSQLPRPQFPVRLATPANYHRPADKNAKTAANNHTARKARSEHGSSSASSVTDIDSGMGSQKSNGEMETQTIEQLDSSPSVKNRLRNTNFQKSRPMEMVLSGARKKTFELRDLEDSIEVTEILPLPPLRSTRLPSDTGIVRERTAAYSRALARDNGAVRSIGTFSSDDEGDEGYEDETGEEKLHRDRLLSEKDEKGILGAGECEADGVGAGEELWGHGEAMAGDDDLSATQSQPDSDQGCVDTMIPPLRSVLLTIEDPTFATLAAMSTSSMLEDEQSPETPDFGSSPSSTSVDPPALPPPPEMMSPCGEKKNLSGSPDSPGTPTHASNSLSLSSDARDFLIDDEIADQPGLMFDETVTGNSSGNTLVPPSPGEETNVAPDLPMGNKPLGRAGRLSVECSPAHARRGSVGTLSPCESIASDDLMLDYDPSETSSTFDDLHIDPRLEGTGLNDLDEAALMSELEVQSDQVLKEWSSLLSPHTGNIPILGKGFPQAEAWEN